MTGFRAKKSLGQHFLRDVKVIKKIINSLSIEPTEHVLEVGPGRGHLTRSILNRGVPLTAIELDTSLIRGPLAELRGKFENFEIYHSDATSVSISDVGLANKPYKFVSNLPYNSGTKILRNILFQENPPQLSIVMLQKEVADNIVGIKRLGILGPIFQSIATCRRLFNVAPKSFNPPPKVRSTVIEFKPLERPFISLCEKDEFMDFIFRSFSSPRKQLHNSLSKGLELNSDQTKLLLENSDVDPKLRPQNLSILEWINIFDNYKAER